MGVRHVCAPAPQSFQDLDLATVAGGEVDEYHITLRISADDLIPEQVTDLLAVQPSASKRKGDLVGPTGAANAPRARMGSWSLKAAIEPGANFEHEVQRLLQSLPSEPVVWETLRSRYRLELFCGVFLRNWNRGMELSPSLLQEIARRGMSLGLDIYALAADA